MSQQEKNVIAVFYGVDSRNRPIFEAAESTYYCIVEELVKIPVFIAGGSRHSAVLEKLLGFSGSDDKIVEIIRKANAHGLTVYKKNGGPESEPDCPVSNILLQLEHSAQ